MTVPDFMPLQMASGCPIDLLLLSSWLLSSAQPIASFAPPEILIHKEINRSDTKIERIDLKLFHLFQLGSNSLRAFNPAESSKASTRKD